ncbi:hypothetical protein LCGC14_1319490 [marine sediment metagenome]|uniref:Uncharacterized protein n=1 Tax=marine sediment metagenome TaxID=412755 RepID=A0A0F9NM89_9ZZZZ
MWQLATSLWHQLSAAERRAWESAGTTRHMTGYAWFMSQALRPNPGVYLPLAGGSMSGDIAMDNHLIVGLADPVNPQDAVNLRSVPAGGAAMTWLTNSVNLLTDLNRTTTQPWATLDLTTDTSPSARMAYLQLTMRVDAYTSSWVHLGVRRNGDTPTDYPSVVGNFGALGNLETQSTWCGMDDQQRIQYTIDIPGTLQVDSWIHLLGYA